MWTRREMLQKSSVGFGWLALQGLLQEAARADSRATDKLSLPGNAGLKRLHINLLQSVSFFVLCREAYRI